MDGEGGADLLISGRYLDRMTKHKTHTQKKVETASGQHILPDMKHGCHPAKYDAWYPIKDYMLSFNNQLCPTVWLYRNIWHGLQIHNIQDNNLPDTVWTKDILNTKQQCNPPAAVLFLVVTADTGTHITQSPSLFSNSLLKVNWSQQQFLFVCAYGTNSLDFTLKSETWQYTAYYTRKSYL